MKELNVLAVASLSFLIRASIDLNFYEGHGIILIVQLFPLKH